ncbi:hypothetical protein [Stenotrophomonas sp. PSU_St99]
MRLRGERAEMLPRSSLLQKAVNNFLTLTACAFLFSIPSGDAAAAQSVRFFVDKAAMNAPDCLRVDSRRLLFDCHQIVPGDRKVFGIRTFYSSWRRDRSSFMKLTVELPDGLKSGDSYKIADGTAKAFRSTGPSAFAGKNGCYGTASSGTITIVSSSPGRVDIQVDALFDQKSPLEWRGECDIPARVSERFRTTELAIGQLDAWTGKADPDASPFDQAHPVRGK